MAKAFENDRQWNWHNFWMCCLISCGQMAFGYPSSIIATTLGQPAFIVYMGLVNKDGLTANADDLIGATSGVFQAGAIFGILIGAWVMDRWGRKAGVIYCATLSIFGGSLLAASQSMAMFIFFRFFAGAGAWGFLALTPVYTAELAPPKLRGFFVGMNGVGITVGYALASYMGLAFNLGTASPAAQWRGPLGLALVFPILMLVVIMIVPESPRWLLMKNRAEEAEKIVLKLHHVDGDPDQEFARGEFYQMQKQSEFDMKLEPSWKEMFTHASYRKRLGLACGFAFISQSTAVLVVNNYGPTLYKALGYGTRDQLILQAGWVTVGIPFNILGACIVDRVGRRPLMIFAVSACCFTLIIEAAMIASFASPIGTPANQAGLGVAVAAFYFFLAFYSVGVDVCGVVFYGELFPNHLRSKGTSAAFTVVALADLVYLQATATAFENIGWKYFLVFIIICALGVVWMYFAIPETKGVPLEEMAKLFGDTQDVMVFSKDIHVDHNTHMLVVDGHGVNVSDETLARVSTDDGDSGKAAEMGIVVEVRPVEAETEEETKTENEKV